MFVVRGELWSPNHPRDDQVALCWHVGFVGNEGIMSIVAMKPPKAIKERGRFGWLVTGELWPRVT